MKLALHRHVLRLRHPFGISRGTKTSQETVIVTLTLDGITGAGEATPNLYYGTTTAGIVESIEAQRDWFTGRDDESPEALWTELAARIDDPFALCALDEAIWDLHGKRRGRSLRELWNLTDGEGPPSSYTIALAEPAAMVRRLHEAPDWPVYKIKLGRPDDLELLRALRAETNAPFRVDANAGWTLDEARRRLEDLVALDVELVEQPLAASDVEGMRTLRAESPLPLVADESCRDERDLDACAELFHGINVKLMKCGGPTPALRLLRRARALGLRTMVGCMTESSVGVAPIAQMLPLLDWVDMDGPALCANDLAEGLRFERGHPVLAARAAGNGVRYLAPAD
ncbi:MAG: dipeptide epimerase [Planctomycetota bacterium]